MRLLLTLCAWCLLSSSARAQDEFGQLSPTEALHSLYHEHVQFARNGEPLLRLRVQVDAPHVRVSSAGRLRWSPRMSAAERVYSLGEGPWHLSVEHSRAGRSRWWRQVARFGAQDLTRTVQALSQWRAKGLQVRAFEQGSLLGFGRYHIDTRTAVIAAQLKRGEAAQPGADRFQEWLAYPTGWIVARHEASGLELRAQDLLMLEAEDPQVDLQLHAQWAKTGRGVRRYGGQLIFFVGPKGKLSVINVAAAEEVLAGTVPAEISHQAPMQALKAQAVAARGLLLSTLGTRHRGQPFHLCDATHCQVYTGRTDHAARTQQAVRETRGEVLIGRSGIVKSAYGSACGGQGEAAHLIWGGSADEALSGSSDLKNPSSSLSLQGEAAVAAFIKQPPASWCAGTGQRAGVFRWQLERSGAELSRRVNAQAKIGPVHGVRVLKRGRSGRALSVAFEGERGRHVVEGEHAHRRLIGRLKSGLWFAERRGGGPGQEPETWVFHGGGYGHGVGLCQHGAQGMAAAGHDYRAILKHYYPGSRLERLW